jgi:hypothetical protein
VSKDDGLGTAFYTLSDMEAYGTKVREACAKDCDEWASVVGIYYGWFRRKEHVYAYVNAATSIRAIPLPQVGK